MRKRDKYRLAKVFERRKQLEELMDLFDWGTPICPYILTAE